MSMLTVIDKQNVSAFTHSVTYVYIGAKWTNYLHSSMIMYSVMGSYSQYILNRLLLL